MPSCRHQIDGPSDDATDSQAGGGATNEGGGGAGQGQPASLSTISFNAADEARQQEQRSSGEDGNSSHPSVCSTTSALACWMPLMMLFSCWVSLDIVGLPVPTYGLLLTERDTSK